MPQKTIEGRSELIVSSPADSEWGRRAVVKDLDGHTVELLTPLAGPCAVTSPA